MVPLGSERWRQDLDEPAHRPMTNESRLAGETLSRALGNVALLLRPGAYVPARLPSVGFEVDHVAMLRLRWPDSPKVVNEGDTLDLSLELENTGPGRAEFTEASLVLFGRLLDEDGRPVVTEGYRLGRRMPAIRYRLDPGGTKTVGVFILLSPDDQRSLPVGRYTVIIPVDEYDNSVLTSTGADPPPPLMVDVRPSRPH